MKKTISQTYVAPTVKVVSFQIEEGFAGSFSGQMNGFVDDGGLFNIMGGGSYSNENVQQGGSIFGNNTVGGGSTEQLNNGGSWF